MNAKQAAAAVADYLGLCEAWPELHQDYHPKWDGLRRTTWCAGEADEELLMAAARLRGMRGVPEKKKPSREGKGNVSAGGAHRGRPRADDQQQAGLWGP